MKRRFVVLAVLVGLVVVLWSGLWLAGALVIRDQVAALAGRTPALKCAGIDVGGFPFRFDVTCSGATLDDTDLTVKIAELRASIRVYAPTHLIVFAKGPAEVGDAFSGAAWRIDWQNLEASVRTDLFALARASLVADGVVVSDTVLDQTEIARFGHAEAHAVGIVAAAGETRDLQLFVKVAEGRLPQAEAPIGLDGTAVVTQWPADLRRWGDDGLLAGWAARGGGIEITGGRFESGALSADVDGTLKPDDAGLVDGTLQLRSRGLAPMMRKFLAAPLAGALLGPEDASGETHQTLTFSRSVLRAGVVPLLELPPLF